MYLLLITMQISTIVVNYRGRPFMHGLTENKGLLRSVVIFSGFAALVASGVCQRPLLLFFYFFVVRRDPPLRRVAGEKWSGDESEYNLGFDQLQTVLKLVLPLTTCAL